MGQRRSTYSGTILTGLVATLCLLATEGAAVEVWKAGADGLRWSAIGQLNGLTTEGTNLIPAVVDSTTNALRNLRQRGGKISSPQSRDDLTTLLTDGNEETFWRVTRERRPDGTSMLIDLGAILPINRIRFIGSEDAFLRAYELFVHDGDPKQLREGLPVAFTNQVRSQLEQDEPLIDVQIPLQFVRFIRLISRSSQEFTLQEAEVFGDGFAPTGEFVSQVIDLGAAANFGRLVMATRTDSLTGVVLQTRTGSVPDPRVFYRKTDIFQGEERSEEPVLPIGSSEAAEEYNKLIAADKGRIEDNTDLWSPWSAPYENFAGQFLSPGNRRYVQFRLFFSSQNARQAAAVETFSFEFSRPVLAREATAEISPNAVVLGERHTFDYYIRSAFDATNPGFDQVEIRTPFKAVLKAVQLDGQPVPFVEDKADQDSILVVRLSENRVTQSGQTLRITFESLVTVYGTTFFAKVFDSRSGELGQDVVPGDAAAEVGSNRIAVQGELRNELILNLSTSPGSFSPNGDGINDELEVSYILLRALQRIPVELTLYDLSGRAVRHLQEDRAFNGPQTIRWNGRDNAGQIVPPGLYLLRLSVKTDTGSENVARLVGVVY